MTMPGGPQDLNTPMRVPPGLGDGSTAAVDAAIESATGSSVPMMEPLGETKVDLPVGWLSPEGELFETAIVRELTGYDEERLSKIDINNTGHFVTKLLAMGVEDIAGRKPADEVLRQLASGDRDSLLLGIRRVTYGKEVKFILVCTSGCGERSEVTVDLDDDIKVTEMEDRLKRTFEVPLKHVTAKVILLNGDAQERIGDAINKKTSAELNTLLMARCVQALGDIMILGNEDPIRQLSAGDRATLVDFIAEHQPGPQLSGIMVNCATCGMAYPISLGLGNLFRR